MILVSVSVEVVSKGLRRGTEASEVIDTVEERRSNCNGRVSEVPAGADPKQHLL